MSRDRDAIVATYREDMRRAWERINSFPTQQLETRLGTIQYADRGEGVPLLVSHGVLGCHVDTVDGWWADLPGPGFRVIGPSRFGYFGSTLPKMPRPPIRRTPTRCRSTISASIVPS
jgi:hypothetical protein